MASSSTSLLQLPFLRPTAATSASRLHALPIVRRRRSVLLLLSSPAASFLAGTLPSRAQDIPLFGLRKKIKKAEEVAEEIVREGEKAVEKEVEVVEGEIAGTMHSVSSLTILSNLGLVRQGYNGDKLLVGEIVVGEMTSLERVVIESKNNYKMVKEAQATVDGVKVDGLDTNLAVMKELLFPTMQLGNKLIFLASWDDPLQSLVFCSVFSYIIFRGWLGYVIVAMLLFIAIFMLLTRFCSKGRPVDQLKVVTPPPMNTMEQLLAVQQAISLVEEIVQDGNIILLKLRALLMAVNSQATDRAILMLVLMALITTFVPVKLMVLTMFLEIFTRNSPPRRESTERCMRRLREWWFSLPAAPVVLERDTKDDKKKK